MTVVPNEGGVSDMRQGSGVGSGLVATLAGNRIDRDNAWDAVDCLLLMQLADETENNPNER